MSKLTYASLAGVGALGTSGLGMYHLYSGESKLETQTKEEVTVEVKNLGSKLTSENFTILSDSPENNHHWATIKEEYDKIKSEPSKSLNPTAEEVTVSTLQALCKDRLEQDREDLYVKVKRWCVVPTKVSEHLANLKLTPLSTTDGDESHKGDWEALSTAYISAESDERIPELIIPNSSEWKQLQKKCKDISEKKSYEDDFDFYLNASISWCTKKSQ
ncbi:hypothetical protein HF1_09070 [Mycoplasma haemofelis str. Langford 1]|uniref:Uncharacterized protein n=1 Tax=Mycoplasma haemofelis (strain Langford 1) TaxID=941640 RepID=E8ZIE4_MYCHL|nr:hypothetical protein [Mycoplasma haemofelis]CBY92915.1 hypothetical protein HF1_09070 [Mycoplasma haemofelis str. Langford 1]